MGADCQMSLTGLSKALQLVVAAVFRSFVCKDMCHKIEFSIVHDGYVFDCAGPRWRRQRQEVSGVTGRERREDRQWDR